MTEEKQLTGKHLRYEIEEIEKVIAGKKSRGEDTKVYEELLQAYLRELGSMQG